MTANVYQKESKRKEVISGTTAPILKTSLTNRKLKYSLPPINIMLPFIPKKCKVAMGGMQLKLWAAPFCTFE